MPLHILQVKQFDYVITDDRSNEFSVGASTKLFIKIGRDGLTDVNSLRRIDNCRDVLTIPIPIPIQPPRRLCCIYTIIKHFKPGVDLIRQGKCFDSSGETIECARSLSQLTHG